MKKNIRTGDIFKLKRQYLKGYNYCCITYPLDGGDNAFHIIDAIPCKEDGTLAEGYEIGVPMEVKNFGKLVGNINDN